MFFQLHHENKIGYKSLTDSDLGRSSSHQTHIGLFDDILTFLPNSIEIPDAMVIYNGNIEFLTANFDRIERANGQFNSPKIKTGGRYTVSVVSFIRDKARDFPADTQWFLFWFGLESNQPVFFVFNDKSDAYNDIMHLGVDLSTGVKDRLEPQDGAFAGLLNYLETIVNQSGETFAEELEVAAQINERISKKYNNPYRTYDIEKAQKIFSHIGREGEELVDKYFSEQLARGIIQHYDWKNKEKESGLPYDFCVEQLDGDLIYLDVKTTNYSFEQRMIFSNREIEFAESCPKYHIYRVYKKDESRCLKICRDGRNLFSQIHGKTVAYENSISGMADVESVKLAVQPNNVLLKFGNEEVL